jgi:hypothetical protein
VFSENTFLMRPWASKTTVRRLWLISLPPAQDIALGKDGKAPGPIDPAILAKVEKQTGSKAVTVRPANLLAPELEGYRSQSA